MIEKEPKGAWGGGGSSMVRKIKFCSAANFVSFSMWLRQNVYANGKEKEKKDSGNY